MSSDIITALAIYWGSFAVLGGIAYYLWSWGGK